MRVVAEKLNFYYDRKSKNKVRALADVDLVIPEGSFFGIIGHTGSGKSTFIQHLNALMKKLPSAFPKKRLFRHP